MKDIIDSLASFAQVLRKKAEDLNTLINDMESMKVGIKEKKPYSRQTIEPMTRLRQSKKELETAKADPDEQFIKDRVNDILGI